MTMGDIIALLFRIDLKYLLVGGIEDAGRSVATWKQSLMEAPQHIRDG